MKVDFLKERKNYEENTDRFQVKETHMSFLFLTAVHVYKMKKPVKYDSADFRTIEARHFNCMEEFRLNKRLAEEVYLEVLPLNITTKGNFTLGGEGEAVDWLVKMKRLKEENMLDFALKNKCLDERLFRKAITKLSAFYRNTPGVGEKPENYNQRIKDKITSNQRELTDPEFGLHLHQLEDIFSQQMGFLNKEPAILKERVLQARVIEAHGDLKPEHICLKEEPLIIDCLEFNRDLRILDTAEELAFLAIECELLGNEKIGDIIFQEYTEITLDYFPESLVNFYKSIQASQRTRFAIWHIKEEKYKNDPKWKKRAENYLNLAQKYAERLQ